jgi:putative membrane protein
MLLILCGILAGLACGLISGLIPGIHSNTMAGLTAGLSPVLLPVFGPAAMAAALVSLLISHSFAENIPAAFCGIPDSGTALSVLPAHALTLAGKGEEAVRLSALGGIYGVIFGIPLSVFLLLGLPAYQGYIDWVSGPLLVLMMGLIIIRDDAPLWSLAIFLLSGVLGLFAFRYEYLCWSSYGAGSILMPLLTGLFGLSVIFTASQGPVPRQHFSGIHIESPELVRSVSFGSLAGLLVGWLPGLSTASASAVISAGIRYSSDRRQYLVATGAASTANAVIGLAAFYGISRMRNGVMVALSLIEIPPYPVLISVCAVAALVSYIVTVRISGCVSVFSGIDNNLITTLAGGFIVILSALLTGPFGILVLVCATAIGFVPYLLNLSRVTCMGAVTIPVILYSLGIGGF